MNLRITAFALLLASGGIALAQQTTDAVAPEIATTRAATPTGTPVIAQNWMVAAANPLAAGAGAKVLRAGGTAADAMIAVQTVLGLVEPQSSGMGGGAFLVWYDAASGKITTLDGRETAPLDATPTLFQDASGAPLAFYDAVVGGRSVGTPGTPKLMQEAHARWGKSGWSTLFDDAARLAEQGFAVSPRLAALVADDAERLASHPDTAAYFLPDGKPLAAGQILKNPAYAAVMRQMAQGGTTDFYSGNIARLIEEKVKTASNPGVLRATDLTIYRVKERPAVCAPYRGYEVCGMGPPSSGAVAVGQILGLLQPYDLATLGPASAESWRLIGDASRLAFADRGRYLADSDFVPVPVAGLLDPAYLAERAKLLAGDDALPEVTAGNPKFDHALLRADDISLELPSTSHISIVDRFGNALSMTTTIENSFGSRVMANGFLLNNELTDFSFASHTDGLPIANRVEPGKRPRSSMAPTIVLKDGKPVLVVGSPGGSRIIGYVAQAIIAHLDWGMDVQAAVAMPHLVNRFGRFDAEAGTSALQGELARLGFEVKETDLNSGLHMIAIGTTLQGGADPRREGVAIGE